MNTLAFASKYSLAPVQSTATSGVLFRERPHRANPKLDGVKSAFVARLVRAIGWEMQGPPAFSRQIAVTATLPDKLNGKVADGVQSLEPR